MDTRLGTLLQEWKKPFLRDQDLAILFSGEDGKRYDVVKYAIKKGILIRLQRGLYLIGPPYKKGELDAFEIAQSLYGPSYISLESALSFHGWIPEAVYVTTSVCAKRSKTIETSIGNFRYAHTPSAHFFLNVERIANKESSFLLAEPWKAVADAIYCYRKTWKSINDLSSDMRIEIETMQQSNRDSLLHIATYYDSSRVRTSLSRFAEELQ